MCSRLLYAFGSLDKTSFSKAVIVSGKNFAAAKGKLLMLLFLSKIFLKFVMESVFFDVF
jgi:hypothetical protein